MQPTASIYHLGTWPTWSWDDGFLFKELSFELLFIRSPCLGLNYIKDCQSILEEVVSSDRTKNNNKITKVSN
jgi:hypothetical protein